MSKLSTLREEIDKIDSSIVELLEKRAQLVLGVKAAKAESQTDIYSPQREQEIRSRVQKLASGGNFPKETLDAIFSSIVGATRSLIGRLSIAHSGPRWSRAYQAAFLQFGADVDFESSQRVEDVFQKCLSGECNFGVVPLETSEGGLLNSTFLSFLKLQEDSLHIVAEIVLPESFALLSYSKDGKNQSASLDTIKTVYGASAAFLETESWFSANLPNIKREIVSNITDIKNLTSSLGEVVFIGSAELASDLDVSVIVPDLENAAKGKSRFAVLSQKKITKLTGVAKNLNSALLVSVPEKSGALNEVLAIFADAKVNILKIESKRLQEKIENFAQNEQAVFYLEIEGDFSDKQIQVALDKLKSINANLKLLGSYPALESTDSE